ncbi:hypothetical protein AB4Y32_15995 [Paraburkholderia phymatum]|uniref:Uncharacterized protein n=1 Tax=Paraburkholderia phymatum TaxID=148447 RepID=A0ACC6U0X6_9BURK
MARPKQDVAEQASAQKPGFVLKKNHGLIVDGKTNQFFAAGTEFDPETDAKLIFALVQSGAVFE